MTNEKDALEYIKHRDRTILRFLLSIALIIIDFLSLSFPMVFSARIPHGLSDVLVVASFVIVNVFFPVICISLIWGNDEQ
jgi:hypothetical protein